jgi:hypothetical protein
MLHEMILNIRKDERLPDVLQRRGYNELPSNCIINKTLPGVGVTHCEMTSPRDSLILEPSIPAVKSIAGKHANALAVFPGVSPSRIVEYLLDASTSARKILATADDFFTVKSIMEELNINMYADFFLLLDECGKCFPSEELREDFFRFHRRSFVSSSTLIASDPLMSAHDFRILTISPDYERRQKLNLITTNNIAETLSTQIASLKEPVCVFCHSGDTIESLRGDVAPLLDKERVSVFTSDYFAAIDVETPSPPHVVLASDLFGAKPYFIDPATEVMQIVGRFRSGVSGVTHIANIDPELSYLTPKQVRAWLKSAGQIYAAWRRKASATQHEGVRKLLTEAIRQSSYTRLVDSEGIINPMRVAEFIDRETLKSLYSNERLLQEAYAAADCFKVDYSREVHIFSDKDRLMLNRKLTQEGRNRILLARFEQLEVLRKIHSSKARKHYRHQIDRLLSNPSDSFLYDCFIEYGANFIRNADYKEHIMRREINGNG